MMHSRGDVVSWTKRISALARSGREAEAVAAFARMDAAPNALTLASVLPACAALRSLALGRAIHGFWLRRGGCQGANLILDNAVLDVYAKRGALCSARRLFDGMPERDVCSWTTMVWGLTRSGSPHDAVAMFRAMLSDGGGAAPNEATVVSVLHAVASTGSLACGKVLHSFALKHGLAGEQVVDNALINAYAKCGDARMAFRAFEELPEKDMVSWATVTRAMAVNGRCREAPAPMLRCGVQPDGAVFLALLSACCHSGQADQALLLLNAMERVYGWHRGGSTILARSTRAVELGGLTNLEKLSGKCLWSGITRHLEFIAPTSVSGEQEMLPAVSQGQGSGNGFSTEKWTPAAARMHLCPSHWLMQGDGTIPVLLGRE